MIAIVSVGYDYSVAVPVDKLSAVLAVLTTYPRVNTEYKDGRELTYLANQRAPRVTLIDALDSAPKTDEE